MFNTSENLKKNFYILSYNAKGYKKGFDFSKIQINGKSLCLYKPNNYLINQNNLFNTDVSFRIMLQLVLLDKKGRIKFLNLEELLQIIINFEGINYSVENYGAYYYLTIKKIPKDE